MAAALLPLIVLGFVLPVSHVTRADGPVAQTPQQTFALANQHYQRQEFERAIELYEASLGSLDDPADGYFFLANSYDNLYTRRRGEPGSDRYLDSAIRNYTVAAERASSARTRQLAREYLAAAYGPEKLNDPAAAEAVVQQMIAEEPTAAQHYFTLARLYESAGRYEDAERTLRTAEAADPRSIEIHSAMAGFYMRQGDFRRAVEAMERMADLEPGNPDAHQRVAVFYWEKAVRDHRLSPVEKVGYIQSGIDAADRALALDPDHLEALTYKNILLRLQANEEDDHALQTRLSAEADALRARAMELMKARLGASDDRRPAGVSLHAGVIAPAVPPPAVPREVDGTPALRVGGHVRPPVKIRDVRPVYPENAREARIQGVVILEVLIDTAGHVRDARVLRSLPLLDGPALEAVRQWQYQPTELQGRPVPVVMTVTVAFTLP